jgi:hypothetical protein
MTQVVLRLREERPTEALSCTTRYSGGIVVVLYGLVGCQWPDQIKLSLGYLIADGDSHSNTMVTADQCHGRLSFAATTLSPLHLLSSHYSQEERH